MINGVDMHYVDNAVSGIRFHFLDNFEKKCGVNGELSERTSQMVGTIGTTIQT